MKKPKTQMSSDRAAAINMQIGALPVVLLNEWIGFRSFLLQNEELKQIHSYFSELETVMVYITDVCNLSCDYCYQDAFYNPKNASPLSPNLVIHTLRYLMQKSTQSLMTIVFSGGEATIVPVSWFKRVIEETKKVAGQMGKIIKFAVQTNASFWNKDLVELFIQERFHISAHFDGLILEGEDCLQSNHRLENIQRYAEMGFPISMIIVGTQPALQRLIETMAMLKEIGISRFHLNYIAPVGRGKNFLDMPSCAERAKVEMDAIFYSSQEDFAIFDSILLEKPFQYFRRILRSLPMPDRPRMMQCGAGERMVHLTADGQLFPCRLFTDKTPFLAKAADLPGVSQEAMRSIQMCKQELPWYTLHCPDCPAYPFCTYHCPLTPIEDQSYSSYFCGSQRELRKLFDANQRWVALIAQRIDKKVRSIYLNEKGSC